MTCKDFNLAWQGRLDEGDWPDSGDALAVERHARTCSHCAQRGRGYRELAEALSAAGRREPIVPARFVAGTLSRLEESRRRSARIASAAPLGLAAAAAITAAIPLVAFFRGRDAKSLEPAPIVSHGGQGPAQGSSRGLVAQAGRATEGEPRDGDLVRSPLVRARRRLAEAAEVDVVNWADSAGKAFDFLLIGAAPPPERESP